MNPGVRAAVVGATGLVGRSLLGCLEKRAFPLSEITLYASPSSEGKVLHVDGKPCRLVPLARGTVREFDLAFFAAPPGVSREFAPLFVKAGAAVIDTSRDWGLEPGTPLLVPEVNPGEVRRQPGILSSPSGAAVPLAVALKPIRDAARIRRAVVTVCQAVSAWGRRALDEFEVSPRFGPACTEEPSLRFDPSDMIPSLPGQGADADRLTEEARKILGDPGLRLTAAFLRVPIRNGTFESIAVETEDRLDPGRVRDLLGKAPAVRLCGQPGDPPAPPTAAVGGDVWIGGVREDPGAANSLQLWAACDNLIKGSALNAVQIAEVLLGV